MIKSMLLSDYLYLVANTMPLFTITSVFTQTDASASRCLEKDIITKLFGKIQQNVAVTRERMPNKSLLFYYKMRNIIWVYTNLLKYLMCQHSGRQRTSAQNSFVVRKQRRCNFCGYHLDQPQRFTFSVKCRSCSLRNATLILPTAQMCDQCTGENSSYVQESSKVNVL